MALASTQGGLTPDSRSDEECNVTDISDSEQCEREVYVADQQAPGSPSRSRTASETNSDSFSSPRQSELNTGGRHTDCCESAALMETHDSSPRGLVAVTPPPLQPGVAHPNPGSPSPPSPHSPPSPPSPPSHQRQPQPIRMTNFCIDEILKPEFGSAKPEKNSIWRAFGTTPPSAVWPRKERANRGHLSELRHSQRNSAFDLFGLHTLARIQHQDSRSGRAEPHQSHHHHHQQQQQQQHHHHEHPHSHRRGDVLPHRVHQTRPRPPAAASPLLSPASPLRRSPCVTDDNPKLIADSQPSRPGTTSPTPSGVEDDNPETETSASSSSSSNKGVLWPAWVYCTRYSDRPSSGPRSRKIKRKERSKPEEKRPRTAFSNEQLGLLKKEFDENRYLTEERRHRLAEELDLNESQIKIWFQNKRAKAKKAGGGRNGLALQLMAQGLYNHSTVPVTPLEGATGE